MTERLYRDDPYLLEFEARVVARRVHQGRPAVVLDRTAFFAESGGQPCDLGMLAGVPVEAVFDDAANVVHVLREALTADVVVRGVVDAERRRDHRQQHHGQHLLSRAFVETASARTVSFHLGGTWSSIDLDREVDRAAVDVAEDRANAVIWEARPVRVTTVMRAEAVRLGLDPAPELGDEVRIVDAEGFDRQACSGTHPRSTAEVGVVTVAAHERHKGGTRVYFACGQRALVQARLAHTRLGQVGQALSAAPDVVVDAVHRMAARAGELERRTLELTDALLTAEAQRLLLSAAGEVLVARCDGRNASELRTLAEKLVTARRCVALFGSVAGGKAHVVVGQTPGLGLDVPALLRDALERLGGRGGGRGDFAQGAGDDVESLDPALEAAASRARSRLLAAGHEPT